MEQNTIRPGEMIEYVFVEGKVSLNTEDIIYIETSKHKNTFYTKEETYSIYKKLSEIEVELKDFGFVRIHQSFLVNMQYVEKISSYIMTLTTGQELSVPKARYPQVKKEYQQYLEESKD